MAKRREARCPGCAKTKDVDRQTALLRVESRWCQMPNIIPSEHDGPMRESALAGRDDWFWACDACISSKRAIVADVGKQVMGLGTPYAAYVDRPFRCEDCDADSVFSAEEQRHWFEKLGFFVGVYPKQCPPCRRTRRRKKRAQKALMETLAGLDPHDRKQLEAVARLYRELGIEKKATEFKTRAKRARR